MKKKKEKVSVEKTEEWDKHVGKKFDRHFMIHGCGWKRR